MMIASEGFWGENLELDGLSPVLWYEELQVVCCTGANLTRG